MADTPAPKPTLADALSRVSRDDVGELFVLGVMTVLRERLRLRLTVGNREPGSDYRELKATLVLLATPNSCFDMDSTPGAEDVDLVVAEAYQSISA